MDLTTWLLGRTPVRPLVVTTVGGTGVRLSVEHEIRRRGWRPALNAAEANLLVVAGPADPAMTPFVDAVWELIPAPRVRIELAATSGIAAALTAAERRLRSPDEQRSAIAGAGGTEQAADAEHVHAEPADHAQDGRHTPAQETGETEHPPAQQEHAEDEHAHCDHGHHHRHDMSGMEMPGGIPMADRADDRDGLKLDRLTVPLGPVLPAWPAGLLVRTVLQGDVVQEAAVEAVLTPRHGMAAFWDDEARIAARRLDSCARLLTVAGWEYAAGTAARLRDDLLAGHEPGARLTRWAKLIRRSRVLRWSLTGIGVHAASGDAWDRLTRWVDEAASARAEADPDPAKIVDALPGLLAGAEFATARLIVASFDPDLERVRVARG
ncbi:hypothetical protein [Amycolatopsis sp. NPDC051371]|uniref:hypothetical protein n=1 Tax=Amycolatopsis sp. NPDC051371 TaxID=3155800 RepID=UPI00342E067E